MISEKQAKILAFPYSKYENIICDGAVRSGKTSIMMVAFVDWAMRCYDRKRFGICGKTVESAVKNIVEPYKAMTYALDRYSLTFRRSDKTLVVKRGNKQNIFEVFGGKDEASQSLIQGRTLAGVLLDEVVLMPQSFVQQAIARCSVEGARLWFSCNPGSPKHWFYTDWIQQAEEHNCLYLHFTMPDNPSLSEKTLQKYKTYYGTSGVFYQRYILGEWVLADGLVYQRFDDDKNTFDDAPFADESGNLKAGAQAYLSVDYGIMNPFAALLWVIYDGVAYCWREYYYDGRKKMHQRTDEEHYAEVEKLAGELFVDEIIVDPSATSFKATVNRHGRFVCINGNNDVIAGIGTLSTLFQAGMVKIHKSCKNFLDEIKVYSWDSDAIEDAVVKENDHACDAARYFAHTILRIEFDWMDWT